MKYRLPISEEEKGKLRLLKEAKKKLATAKQEIALTIPIFESIAKHRKDCVMFAPRQVARLLRTVRRSVKANQKRMKEGQAVLDAHEAAKQKRREIREFWRDNSRSIKETLKKQRAEGRI